MNTLLRDIPTCHLFLFTRSPTLEAPLYLVRDFDAHTQLFRKRPHRCGVALELPSYKYNVCLAFLKHVIRNVSGAYPANGRYEDFVAVLTSDSLREMRLIRDVMDNRTYVDTLKGGVSARRNVDKVYPAICEDSCEPYGIFKAPTGFIRKHFFEPVSCRDPTPTCQ